MGLGLQLVSLPRAQASRDKEMWQTFTLLQTRQDLPPPPPPSGLLPASFKQDSDSAGLPQSKQGQESKAKCPAA